MAARSLRLVSGANYAFSRRDVRWLYCCLIRNYKPEHVARRVSPHSAAAYEILDRELACMEADSARDGRGGTGTSRAGRDGAGGRCRTGAGGRTGRGDELFLLGRGPAVRDRLSGRRPGRGRHGGCRRRGDPGRRRRPAGDHGYAVPGPRASTAPAYREDPLQEARGPIWPRPMPTPLTRSKRAATTKNSTFASSWLLRMAPGARPGP